MQLKDKDIELICSGLEYQQLPKNAAVMRYGEEGERFYLILKGKVSIWVPVPHANMKEPLEKFK